MGFGVYGLGFRSARTKHNSLRKRRRWTTRSGAGRWSWRRCAAPRVQEESGGSGKGLLQTGSSLNSDPFRPLIRVPYYIGIGDLQRDPNLEKYPYRL